MTRNILSGKIKFEFQRKDESGELITLSEEEAKPYQDNIDQAIQQAKVAQESQSKPQMEVVK
jgi:hypothetical protein